MISKSTIIPRAAMENCAATHASSRQPIRAFFSCEADPRNSMNNLARNPAEELGAAGAGIVLDALEIAAKLSSLSQDTMNFTMQGALAECVVSTGSLTALACLKSTIPSTAGKHHLSLDRHYSTHLSQQHTVAQTCSELYPVIAIILNLGATLSVHAMIRQLPICSSERWSNKG